MVKYSFFLALILIFSILIFSPSVHAQAPDKAELAKTLFQFALNLYYKGSLEQAAEEFKKIVDTFPESDYADDALYWLSKYYQTQENYDLATKSLIRIIEKYPQADQVPTAYYELGNLLSNTRNPSRDLGKARIYYLKMSTLYPQNTLVDTCLLAIARVSFLLEDYASGIDDARKVLWRHPQDRLGAEAQWLIARTYLRMGYELQALKECQFLRDRFPGEKLAASAKDLATQIYRHIINKTYEPAAGVEWQSFADKPLKIISLKFDNQDSVLLLDKQQGVLRYTPQGKFQTAIEGKGNVPQNLIEATALAVDEDNDVYVLDGNNAIIYKFSSTGRQISALPIRNPAQEYPKGATSLAVSPAGIIWVADPKGGKIWELDEKGKLLGVWGKEIDKGEDLDQPADLALDQRGFLWVLDRGTKRLYKFNAQKKLIGKVGNGIVAKDGKEIVFGSPIKVTVDDAGYAFVLDTGSLFGKGGIRIINLDEKMNLFQEINNPKGEHLELKDPAAITLDSQGRIWVSDLERKNVIMFQ
jgi:outer membrane protein assembly factor BamD (BamD/ComL family)/sugar lactone lactonase YvrE